MNILLLFVEDNLADAHVLAPEYLLEGGRDDVFNCGYGQGYSARQVVDAAKKVTGVDFPVEYAPRRPSDPQELVADSTKIKQKLGWKPRFIKFEIAIPILFYN